MQSQTLRPSPNRPVRRFSVRSGFSLIELVVVILIIAILASLILNGVMAARTTALSAAAASDIKNLEKAIGDFKLKFGVEPPSSITLYEDPAGWAKRNPPNTVAQVQESARSRAIIRQIWPQFDFTLRREINGDRDPTPDDEISLQGAECLAFFLGGVCSTDMMDQTGATIASGPPANSPVKKWIPLGFSINPSNPFARGGTRVGPFVELDSDRLINIDGDTDPEGAPEYLDTLPGQTKPLIYASSYDGRGYRASDLVTGPGCTFTSVYTKTGGQPYNPKSFQIISAGFDSDYGTGGVFDTTLPANRSMERDNITNFKGGRLE